MTDVAPLHGLRVVECAGGIAGPYCGKLLVDAGAEVVKVEPPAGDPLRTRALFDFLNAGKQSVVGALADGSVDHLLARADLLVVAQGLDADPGPAVDLAALRRAHPHLVIAAITPYGTTGPWADRRANEFTLQAESGGLNCRGLAGRPPFQAGGRVTEWAGGVYAAVGALPLVLGPRGSRAGALIDVSLLEVANLIFTNYSETMNRLINGSPDDPEHAFLAPVVDVPSVEPTSDGFVGFTTNAQAQFTSFLEMIERTDLIGHPDFSSFAGRMMRFAEWNEIVHGWTTARTTAQVVARASELRIPVAPVCNGATVLELEHLRDRGVFVESADGTFLQPRPPYRIDDHDPAPPARVPALGEHDSALFLDGDAPEAFGASAEARPLAGLRVLDLTAWWAGPAATHVLAAFGAEVVHVESAVRLDGLRSVGGIVAGHYPRWWEASPHFLHTNTNKLGVTLDFGDAEGRALLDRLIEWCDVVVENFTPRVLEGFGITEAHVRERNPQAVFVRMPAFGLTGPWRDYPGFAQTVEQLSGLAWLTGEPDDQPRVPRGPCDPLAGAHGAFAVLVALATRSRSGRGALAECTMVEMALNLAAEQVVEWTAHGVLLERTGNRSPEHAPQGLYPCTPDANGAPQWLALSITSAADWAALTEEIPALAGITDRRAEHDAVDAHIAAWSSTLAPADAEARLRQRGLAASALANQCRLIQTNPQLQERHYFEAPPHPEVGPMPVPTLPFRVEGIDRWVRSAAPTLGQHNHAVLGGILGLSDAALADLEARGIIATTPITR